MNGVCIFWVLYISCLCEQFFCGYEFKPDLYSTWILFLLGVLLDLHGWVVWVAEIGLVWFGLAMGVWIGLIWVAVWVCSGLSSDLWFWFVVVSFVPMVVRWWLWS